MQRFRGTVNPRYASFYPAKATLCLAAVALIYTTAASGELPMMLIRGARLIDGRGGPPVQTAAILIQGNRISRVSERAIDPPAGAIIIEAGGKTVIPGLIDSHVHFREWSPELYVERGITSIFDYGDPAYWVSAIMEGQQKGKISGPRFYGVGGRLSAAGDYRRSDLIGPPPGPKPHLEFVSNAAELTRLLDEKAQARLNAVKVDQTFTVKSLAEIASLAHGKGFKLLGHSQDAREAILAGQDQIVHMDGIAVSTLPDQNALKELQKGTVKDMFAVMDPSKFQSLIDLMVARGTYLNPTVLVRWGAGPHSLEYEREDHELLLEPSLSYVPLDVRLAIFKAYRLIRAEERDKAQGLKNVLEFLRRYSTAGGKLCSGTDTIVSTVPGASLHRELRLLVEAGVSPMQVLLSATRHPAEMFNIDKDLGTIEPGKLADILVLDADPLDDIRNTQKISTVIQDGKVIDRNYHSSYHFPLPRPFPEDAAAFYPQPELQQISPGFVREGAGDVELVIRGDGFFPESVLTFAGKRIPARFVNRRELRAAVPAALFARAGTYWIEVSNPLPSGGTSNELGFVVQFR